MNDMTKSTSPTAQACVPMPEFERLNFYYGQTLGVADFQTEQRYFLEKLRLYNRCFHGYGIVCGLEVKPVPTDEDCDSDDQRKRQEIETDITKIDAEIAKLQAAEKGAEIKVIKQKLEKFQAERESLQRRLDKLPNCYPKDKNVPAEVYVNCGWAVDCEGREIIVRQPQKIDLWSLLSAEQVREVKQGQDACDSEIFMELRVCYCEQPTYPSRPVVTDTCAAVSKCVYGRTREGFAFRVSFTASEPDKRCSNCCEVCENECIVLAHIHWNPTRPITVEDIDWSLRRNVTLYQATVITGVSWKQGAVYTSDQAKNVLGTEQSGGTRTDGVEVVFSKSVYAETLQPGVVDLWRIQGGKGLSGVISHIEGSFVDKPENGLINSFKYRDDSGETLNKGDQVLIIIRGNFILDECCQPVDAEHVGGLVPQLEDYQNEEIDKDKLPQVPPCAQTRHQPWTSGNGRPGATFESWFFIN